MRMVTTRPKAVAPPITPPIILPVLKYSFRIWIVDSSLEVQELCGCIVPPGGKGLKISSSGNSHPGCKQEVSFEGPMVKVSVEPAFPPPRLSPSTTLTLLPA